MPIQVFTDLWLPAFVALVVALPGILLPRRKRSMPRNEAVVPGWAGLFSPLSVLAAAVAIHLLTVGRPVWPPPSLTERLLPAFVAGGLLSIAANVSRRRMLQLPVLLLASAAPSVIVLWPMLSGSNVALRGEAVIVCTVAALCCVISTVCVDTLDRRGAHIGATIIAAGIALAGGGAMLGAGNLKLGQFGLALGAAGLVLVLLAALTARVRADAPTASSVFSLLTALLVAASRYATLRPAALILALAAPGALIAHTVLSRKLRPWAATLISIGIAAAIAGAMVALCVDLPTETDGAGDEYDYGAME